jgi:hypothetical protein
MIDPANVSFPHAAISILALAGHLFPTSAVFLQHKSSPKISLLKITPSLLVQS